MSDIDNEEVLVQDELTTLKARATTLGLTFHPSIGREKLREKVVAALSDAKPGPDEDDSSAPVKAVAKVEVETAGERRARLKREANELIRVRITCMNPAKKEWEGEIITAGNSAVGSVKKYVPFNADDGWHVPNIILEQLKERRCQVFTTVRDGRGNNVRQGKQIKEFAIEMLPSLTRVELDELARRQALAKAID